MENDIIYIVKDINDILTKFSLTTADKAFIVNNTYNSLMRLQFFILESNGKLTLLVKPMLEERIYKLKCPEISNINTEEYFLKDLILKTDYKLDKSSINIQGVSIPVTNIPYPRTNIRETHDNMYIVAFYIKNQEEKRCTIIVKDKNKYFAINKMINVINVLYDKYLYNEYNFFNTKENHINPEILETLKKLTGHTNLDVIKKEYKSLFNSSEELESEPET